MVVAIASILAVYILIFDDRLSFRADALFLAFLLAVIFIYLSVKKARITIFDDRLEFTEFRAPVEVIKFADITKIEMWKGYRSIQTIVTTKVAGREVVTILPYVYNIPFYELRGRLQKWHDDPLGIVHSLSDGAQDRDVWNAPGSMAS